MCINDRTFDEEENQKPPMCCTRRFSFSCDGQHDGYGVDVHSHALLQTSTARGVANGR